MYTTSASFHIKAVVSHKELGRVGNLDRTLSSEENLCFSADRPEEAVEVKIAELVKLVLGDVKKLRAKLLRQGRTAWVNDIRIQFEFVALGATGNLVNGAFFWCPPFSSEAENFRCNLYSGGVEKFKCSLPSLGAWAETFRQVATKQTLQGIADKSVNCIWAPAPEIFDIYRAAAGTEE